MPKVYCAAMDCEFNSDKGLCTAKSIALSSASVMTVWEGRQDYNKCKTFQKSQEAIRIQEIVDQYYKRWTEEHKNNNEENEI